MKKKFAYFAACFSALSLSTVSTAKPRGFEPKFLRAQCSGSFDFGIDNGDYASGSFSITDAKEVQYLAAELGLKNASLAAQMWINVLASDCSFALISDYGSSAPYSMKCFNRPTSRAVVTAEFLDAAGNLVDMETPIFVQKSSGLTIEMAYKLLSVYSEDLFSWHGRAVVNLRRGSKAVTGVVSARGDNCDFNAKFN